MNNNPPPFHPLTTKRVGDRVKVPRCYTDESNGFFYGTIIEMRNGDARVSWDIKNTDAPTGLLPAYTFIYTN